MYENKQSLETLDDIKRMMERSSRFISLSGLSGISAGICALVGAWLAHKYIFTFQESIQNEVLPGEMRAGDSWILFNNLFLIAVGTLVVAILSAFIFTWMKSKQQGIPIWGKSARRLLFNLSLPLAVGSIFLLRLIHFGNFAFIAPGCLIFYGLALINASKYTLNDIRYLGYLQIVLGIINLWFVGYGLYFWAIGFGILHIVYGAFMWWKYERVVQIETNKTN